MATILDTLHRFFIPPDLLADEETQRIAHLVIDTALLGFVLTLAYTLVWTLIMPAFSSRLVFTFIALAATLLTLVLVRLRQVKAAGLIYHSGIWLLITLATPSAGGTRATFYSFYIILVMFAALVSGWRTAFVFAGLSIISGLVMVIADEQGLIPPPIATPLSAYLTQILIMTSLAAAVYAIVRRSDTALRRARHELAERQKIEAALRESEERYRIVSEMIGDYAFAYDVHPDGTFDPVWITDSSFTRLTGYPWNEIGASFKLYHPDDLQRAQADVARTVRGEDVSGEYRTYTKDGRLRWLHIRRRVLRDEKTNHIVRFYGAAEDITERKTLEASLQRYNTQLESIIAERTAQLRRAKEQIEAILNNTHDAVALTQPNGDVQTINPAFVETFGDSHAIEGILSAVTTDDQISTVSSALVKVIAEHQQQRVEARITARDGQDKDIDLAFIPVNIVGDEQGILVSAHDITHVKEIERFKSRFIADALHDMATPITGLSTRLYLLKRSPAKLDEHVRALENQVEHLRDLLMDLRTLSQIDRGHLELSRESCPIEEPLRRIFDTYEPVAISHEQTLELAIDPSIPELPLDRRLFERVLVNLVSNAIKYSADGTAITIQARRMTDTVEIAVIDQGMGISAEDLPHVFERFYRTEQARLSQTSGTGLGLSIVKDIIELHGGHVTAESTPGKGSTFRVTLPISP